MKRHYILDDSGEPREAEFMEWAAWLENIGDKRRIDFTKLPNCEVSTVFLGLDHRFGDGPPLIFETMVFGGTLSDEMDRYSTRAEAVEGHKAMVERCKNEVNQ